MLRAHQLNGIHYLESQGYKVIRFWKNKVMSNIEDVLVSITQKWEEQS